MMNKLEEVVHTLQEEQWESLGSLGGTWKDGWAEGARFYNPLQPFSLTFKMGNL